MTACSHVRMCVCVCVCSCVYVGAHVSSLSQQILLHELYAKHSHTLSVHVWGQQEHRALHGPCLNLQNH